MKNEKQRQEWLEHYRAEEPHFGLERMVHLLSLRGNPHLKRRVIHIAGTNGKGSTIAHLRQLLQQLGLKVGTFTSPYLTHYSEQIAINGQAISETALKDLLHVYQQLVQKEQSSALEGVTEFEILTALAYDYFDQEEVDVAIIEVGMGGRLDSTNVCQPLLTGITTIGLDHVALLGDSLEKIAAEKAGILKKGAPLVTGKIAKKAFDVIQSLAIEKEIPHLSFQEDYQVEHRGSLDSGECFFYKSSNRSGLFQTSLYGLHQVDNAAMALTLFDTFCQLTNHPLLSNEEIEQALQQTLWSGRFECIQKEPVTILDGAHNPHAVQVLADSLTTRFVEQEKDILFTCIKTKALEEMLDLLEKIPQARVTLTYFDDERATDKETMEKAAKEHGLDFMPWQEFIQKPSPKDTVRVITGSLYFLVQVRAYLMERKEENGY